MSASIPSGMLRALAGGYIAVVLLVLVWPDHPEAGVVHALEAVAAQFGAHSARSATAVFWATEYLGNLALFVPVGFLVQLASRRWWAGGAAGLIVSAVGEATQFFIPGRDASIIDVATNTVGACVGAAVVLLGRAALARGAQRRRTAAPV